MTTSIPTASSEPLSRAVPTLGMGPFSKLPVSLSPNRSLLSYYVLSSLLLGPAFAFALVPRYFRFRTMRYEVDEEGITMRWGLLFRREISLTYARIQDIHLSSNFAERWLGLARIQVQTASGSAKAELTIEGLPHAESIRDFLYTRMRGAKDLPTSTGPEPAPSLASASVAELTSTLREVAAELRALRETLPAADEAHHG